MTDTATEERQTSLAEIPLARDLVPADRRLLPAPMEVLEEGADLIQKAGGFVSPDVRNDRGACVALAYMSALHGTDLIATASKAYLVPGKGGGPGRLAFEAQYISALVRRHVDEPFDITFSGSGTARVAKVVGKVNGKALEYISPQLGQIKTKNSPLWFVDPDQQLGGYYSVRAWARRHKPDVLLGIYAVEELQQITVRDVTPPPPDAFAAEEPEIEDAEVEGEPFEPSGGFATDAPRKPYQESGAAPQDEKADDPLEWAEGVKQDIDACEDEPALVALFQRTEANRRALLAADKAASKDLDDRFTQRQKELRAG